MTNKFQQCCLVFIFSILPCFWLCKQAEVNSVFMKQMHSYIFDGSLRIALGITEMTLTSSLFCGWFVVPFFELKIKLIDIKLL